MLWVIVIVAISSSSRSWSSRCTTGSSGCATARRTLVPGRRPAPAPLRPHPESRRVRQGLRRPRAATFEDVTKARTAAQQAQGIEEQAKAENMLTAALGRLFAVAEAYPAAASDRELPAAPGSARRHRAEHRRLAPGLQRHRPHVRKRARDRADEHRRRPLQLQPAGLLRDGRRHAGGAGRAVLHLSRLGSARRRAVAAALLWPAASAAKSYSLPAADVAVQVQPDGRSAFRSRSPSTSPARSAAPIATSRCGGRVDRPGRRQRGERRRIGRVPIPRSAASGCRTASASPRSPTALGSSGTTARATSGGPSPSPTASAGSRRLRRRRRRESAGLGRRVAGRAHRLTAAMELPRPTPLSPSYRVWGSPVWVRGTVDASPRRGRVCKPSLVPSHQFVELRVVFPRSLLTSTAGAQVRNGNGLQKIVAEEVALAARVRARP